MTLASGVGSMPGGSVGDASDNARVYDEATRIVFGELDLPHVPELPGRGAVADMVGRTLGLVTDLGADLQPAGWRLTDAAGMDQRRARSLLAQDLDCVEEHAALLVEPGRDPGWFKTQVAGPWTLAATVEKPRGDRVLS
ncbi:MAG: methionine synthase, partial [Actinomycetota bacterium]|nr:methionine synthase [Actinomycetota bacterium]